MKVISFLLASLICFSGFAQRTDIPLPYYIDRTVRAYDASAHAILVKEITRPSQADLEKVTAIFRWITNNISYNIKAASKNGYYAMHEDTGDDTARVLKPLNLRIAETVLKRKMAICDGYARLF
ncbi:MAG: transglutaminase-like domain-containing protein [Bacteroidota bacterium]